MAFPTTETELGSLLDNMVNMGASDDEKKAVIDRFFSEQKAKPGKSFGIPQAEQVERMGDTKMTPYIEKEDIIASPISSKIAEKVETGVEELKQAGTGTIETTKEGIERSQQLGQVEELQEELGMEVEDSGMWGEAKANIQEGLGYYVPEYGKEIPKAVTGLLDIAFAIPVSIIEEIPGGKAALGFVGDKMNDVSTLTVEKTMPNATEEEKQAATQGLNNFMVLMTMEAGPKIAEAVKKTGKGIGKGITKATEKTVETTSGLKPETIETVIKTPEAVSKVQEIGVETARGDVFGKVKESIDTKISELSETGKQYESIKTSTETVTLPETFWGDELNNLGLKLEEGEITANSASKLRAQADVNAFQNVYDMYGGKTSLTAEEFLNLRSDLSQMSKFETGKTNAATAAAKQIRKDVDTYGKEQLSGLKELDAEYAPKVKELQLIKKEIYDSKGNLKDNAISTVNNLLGKGKEMKLARLEEASPGLTAELKAIKAAQNILEPGGVFEKQTLAGGRIAGGTYAAATGNLPLLLGIVATSPSIIIPILKAFGKAKGILSESQVASFAKKITDGTKLSVSESKMLTNLFDKISGPELVAAGVLTQEQLDQQRQ